MRIARLLIYEGTKEDLDQHFRMAWVKPGDLVSSLSNSRVKVTEGLPTSAGGRVEILPGEIAAIKVVK